MFSLKALLSAIIAISCLAAAMYADASPQPSMQVASSMEVM